MRSEQSKLLQREEHAYWFTTRHHYVNIEIETDLEIHQNAALAECRLLKNVDGVLTMLVKITTNFGIVNGTRQWVKAAANEEYLENVNLASYTCSYEMPTIVPTHTPIQYSSQRPFPRITHNHIYT